MASVKVHLAWVRESRTWTQRDAFSNPRLFSLGSLAIPRGHDPTALLVQCLGVLSIVPFMASHTGHTGTLAHSAQLSSMPNPVGLTPVLG
jgi:hypothetical protein